MGGEKGIQAKAGSKDRKPKPDQTKSMIHIHCAHDALVKIRELKPHPKNRNSHPREQIDRLAKIIAYQGIRAPIKVSRRSGFITAGHGRLEAFKRLKLKSVPVNYQEYESDEQEYADLQADNAIASWSELDLSGIAEDLGDLGPGFDLDLLGIREFEIQTGGTPGCDEDEVPELKDSFVKNGDIWQLGQHRLMCGDSTKKVSVDELMGDEKADMVFTDPPYGIDIVKGGTIGGGNIAKPGKYKSIDGDQTTEVARAAYNLIVGMEIPIVCFWGGNYFTEFLPPRMGWIVWDKRGEMASNKFSDCELAWTNLHTWNGMIRERESGKRVHPTQKPIALAEYCFENLGLGSVLDLFGGSGSTLIACEKTKRKCFMMEIDPHYCSVIIERWQKYTGKKAKRINGKK